MTDVVTKAALTPARKRLIELTQEINYGRIESLEVRNRAEDRNFCSTITCDLN